MEARIRRNKNQFNFPDGTPPEDHFSRPCIATLLEEKCHILVRK
jgi:hypothetical protein